MTRISSTATVDAELSLKYHALAVLKYWCQSSGPGAWFFPTRALSRKTLALIQHDRIITQRRLWYGK